MSFEYYDMSLIEMKKKENKQKTKTKPQKNKQKKQKLKRKGTDSRECWKCVVLYKEMQLGNTYFVIGRGYLTPIQHYGL